MCGGEAWGLQGKGVCVEGGGGGLIIATCLAVTTGAALSRVRGLSVAAVCPPVSFLPIHLPATRPIRSDSATR